VPTIPLWAERSDRGQRHLVTPNHGLVSACRSRFTQRTSRSAWSARSLLSLLPLSKAKGARQGRPAASHARCQTVSLSSSRRRGPGRGGPSLIFRILDCGRQPQKLLLANLSDFVIRNSSVPFPPRSHSRTLNHTYRSHSVTPNHSHYHLITPTTNTKKKPEKSPGSPAGAQERTPPPRVTTIPVARAATALQRRRNERGTIPATPPCQHRLGAQSAAAHAADSQNELLHCGLIWFNN